MMRRKGNKKVWKKGIVWVLILIFSILLLNAFAEEEKTRIADLEKEELSDEDNEALREYYGQVFGIVGPDTQFNNIATKENIAIINVTIDGRDRRIITKLATGVVLPKIADKLVAALLQADNVTVFDYLRILGKTIFSAATSFGERSFYGVESSEAKYVDEGFSRLINGKANVSVNPVLRELISRYNVYLSAEGLTKGIYVSEKSSGYFVVKSVNENSNVGFSWMLRGIKKAADGKFESIYAERLGIDITATINNENGTATIRIYGLDKILELVNKYNNQIISNITSNETNQNNNTNGTQQDNNANEANNNENNPNNGQGIQVITGNVIDEFGLENNLGGILSDTPQTLPEIGNPNINVNINPINDNTNNNNDQNNNLGNNENSDAINNPNNQTNGANTDLANNETSAINETDNSVLEFVLFSVDESFIVSQISEVTGLHADDVRKLVTFVYADPAGFENEVIEPAAGKIDGIEKINGSVIIRLG